MLHWLPAIFAFVLPLAATALGVRLILPWLRARAVLDRPNARSSHTQPTPRGGGIVVVAVLIVSIWAIYLASGAPLRHIAIVTMELGALGLVSWIDDRRGAPVWLRLAVQLAAVSAGLANIGVGAFAERAGVSPWLIAIPIGLAWMWFVNLYNFMDGIDGITGTETASIGVGLVALAVVTLGSVASQGLTGLALTGAAIGFLVWNWHPARIFLGDVGSVPLGFLVGGWLIEAALAGQWAPALILPLYYLADATLTLIARVLRGERLWQAHKSHFYQRAHQGGLSHGHVSLCIGALNVVLIALAAAAGLGWTWLALALAAGAVAAVLAFFGSRRPLELAKTPPYEALGLAARRASMGAMQHLIRSPQAFVAFAHDVMMAALSFLAALYLRLGGVDFADYAERLAPSSLPVFVACCAVVFAAMGLYRGIWRYASLNDVIAIVKATAIAVLIFVPLQFLLTRLEDLPRSQIVINWLVLVAFLTGPRVAYRILRDRRVDYVLKRDRGRTIPVLLHGAGDEAELFLRALARQPTTPYEAVGIVARKGTRVGRRIHGVDVLGTDEELAEVVAKLDRRGRKPRRLIVTIPDIDGEKLAALFERADALGMTVARVPRATDFREGAGGDGIELRPIAIEDLLGRPQTVLDRPAMQALCLGKRVLVTGAGGSIGSELVRQISDFGPARLALLDSSEYQLYEIDLELSRRHAGLARAALLADVRDARRLAALIGAERPEIVFHAAALKHVPMVEAHPDEGVLTNAIGTRIVADACAKHAVGCMVVISTDKAVNPTSVMGASKRLAEQYCQALDLSEARKQSGAGTHFVIVRFGNVLGSTGSVVPLFQKQLAEGGPLTVTHPEVDRYFMTVREAVELVLMASAVGASDRRFSGKVFVLDMGQPVKIVELAKQMIRLAGKQPGRDIKISFTGLRPGEKLREELLHAQEDLVPTGAKSILLASPRTSDLKLLARAFDDMERHARAGATQEALALLKHLVPEYRPTPNGAADESATAN